MKIQSLRVIGIRCFEDTGDIHFSQGVNIFVGHNNSGKSTLLRSILSYQQMPFSTHDTREEMPNCYTILGLTDVEPVSYIMVRPPNFPGGQLHVFNVIKGAGQSFRQGPSSLQLNNGQTIFQNSRPRHTIVPILAKRKATQFDQDVSLGKQTPVLGTFSNIYSRIDLLATAGHPRHEKFLNAVRKVIGIQITTKASPSGKEAGFYLNQDKFVTLDQMGDGVTELIGLIVELCLESDRIFLLEEPETNLHPKALKALLSLIRHSTAEDGNQFFIATHSNLVVRELGFEEKNRIFKVFRNEDVRQTSSVKELPKDATAHAELLSDLGYEFTDLGHYDGWLFLEESSAEEIIEKILIPKFCPNLVRRIRTFSANGVTNLEPKIEEFQRLVIFIHLQPIYQNRLWIRADGDPAGRSVIASLRAKFPYLDNGHCDIFQKPAFEYYYPEEFQHRVVDVFDIKDRAERRHQKALLLKDVIKWSFENEDIALEAWSISAVEPIKFLRSIETEIS